MLKDLNFNFILDYEYYLKTEKKLQQSTLNKAIQRVRKVLSYAINQNYLQKRKRIVKKLQDQASKDYLC